MSLKVLSKLIFDGKTSLAVEGDCTALKNGDTIVDENGKAFIIVSVGMTHYENPEHWKTMANILIDGVDFAGERLTIKE
ncbi:hypothetical protein FMM68_09765 [Lachnospiraceae bacterium MD329]|nr:hypothetical protein [Lachnospiraceae bacterium MD329]